MNKFRMKWLMIISFLLALSLSIVIYGTYTSHTGIIILGSLCTGFYTCFMLDVLWSK